MTALYVPAAGDQPTAAELLTLVPKYSFVGADVVSASDGTTVTQSNITGLSFACEAGCTYHVQSQIRYTATDTTTDLSISKTAPAGTVYYGLGQGQSTAVSTGFNPVFTGDSLFAGAFGADSGIAIVEFSGLVICTASGTFQMTFSRGTAVLAKTTTVKAGSFLLARQVV